MQSTTNNTVNSSFLNWRLIDSTIQDNTCSMNIAQKDLKYNVSATQNNTTRHFSIPMHVYKHSFIPIEICNWPQLQHVTFEVEQGTVVKILDCKPTLHIEGLEKQEPVIYNSQIACLHCGRINSKENSAKLLQIKSIGHSK